MAPAAERKSGNIQVSVDMYQVRTVQNSTTVHPEHRWQSVTVADSIQEAEKDLRFTWYSTKALTHAGQTLCMSVSSMPQ